MEKAVGIMKQGLKMLKVLLGMALVLCLLVGVCLSPAEAVENKRVRVGYFYLPGYHELDDDGHLLGYGYDLIQRLKLYNNWRCEYIGYDKKWDEGFEMLERGDIDMLTGVRMRADRLDKYEYSSSPIGRSSSVLVVREDDIRYTSGNYSTYHGMRIGALKGSIVNINFADFAREKGFDYSIHYYEHMPELLEALCDKKNVDAVLTTSMRFMQKERVLDQFDSEYLYAIVKKGNRGLLQEINHAIHKMDYVNPMWRQDLYAKYYTPRKGNILPMAHDEFAYRELANAADRRFRVLVNPDRRPYSYVENGEFKGIFPRLMQEIARRSGLKYEFVPVGSRKEYLEVLRKQQADLVLDLPEDNYHAERLGYRLSEPLMSTTLFSVKLRSNTVVPKRLAFVKSAYDMGKVPEFLPRDTVIHKLDSFDECVQGVLSGKYDATYMYAFQAQDVVGRDATQQLVMAIVPSVKLAYCIGINANESRELASIINKAVVSVRGDFLEQLMGSFATTQSKPSLLDEILNNPWAIGTIVFVLVGIMALLVLLYMRQKNMVLISKKNEQLQEQQELLSRALEQAEASNKAKTVFLNSVSHDIRTPMNAIMGFAKLALEQAVNPVTKRYLEKIIFSGKNLLSLINDVLDMSSIENGKLKVHESPCDLVDLLKSIHEMLLPAAKQKDIQLLLDISRVAHSRVISDQMLLQRVLLNFLSNSIKYTNDGGIVHVRAE
ncbi:MAG: transporter substrate-binding domain-containing protein, partial [Phascolarctobacterium sp.]